MSALQVIIVGASGYTGAELVRLLAAHPDVEITAFVSSTMVGADVATHLPVWRGRPPAQFQPLTAIHDKPCDAVFFATPNEVAMREVPSLLREGKVVIDLGAAFRLRDIAEFNQWYGEHTAAELLSDAVYGLSETAATPLKNANLIACPGCYATAVELALIPLCAGDCISGDIIVDAKSGVSGAGRRTDRADLLLAEMADNFKAYAVDGHRHYPEIMQTLRTVADSPPPSLTFVPHLLPLVRGIHANIYATVRDAESVLATIGDYWRECRFIEVLAAGMVAELSHVIGGNRVIISVHPLTPQRVMVTAVLDNLIKGAAGQAVQNMNIRFGLDEAAGLSGAMTV